MDTKLDIGFPAFTPTERLLQEISRLINSISAELLSEAGEDIPGEIE